MVTQVVEFEMVTGETGATAKLFAPASDTVVASVAPSEATNRKGVYSASFTDIAAGTYRLIGFGSDGVPLTDPLWVTLTLTDATFIASIFAASTVGVATAAELAKVPKQGETRRYTQIAANAGSKTADVSIGAPL